MAIEIFPAIDILGAKVVRLAQGNYADVTQYGDDPVAQAQEFARLGAKWLHIVDLDGAKCGEPKNTRIIEEILATTNLKIEIGGGVRNMNSIERLAKAGASRIVIGTALINDRDFACAAVDKYGDLICAGIDAKAGKVATCGWLETTNVDAATLAAQLSSWGIRHLVYTDIARDGMQSGIDTAAYEHMSKAAGFAVTASGGISTLDDIAALCALTPGTIEAIICGRALYEGKFSVAQAIEVTGNQK